MADRCRRSSCGSAAADRGDGSAAAASGRARSAASSSPSTTSRRYSQRNDRAECLEQPVELLLGRIVDLDLVRNAPQERLVRQVGGIQVRGEDDQLLERHLDLLAGGEREEIVPVLQGNDPAIEQLRRLDPLPAEVVDQQAAAVALELQRRLAHVAQRVVADLQGVHGQFAAHDHRGRRILIQRRSWSVFLSRLFSFAVLRA